MTNPTLKDLILKFSLVLLGLIYPLIMVLWIGQLPSISKYFETPAQALFLLVNAGTSFYFTNTKGWVLPGILLLFLSCFSLEYYVLLHNICAILFFTISVITVAKSKRYSYLFIPMILSGFGLFHSIFLAEYLLIIFLCLYHGLILYDIFKIKYL